MSGGSYEYLFAVEPSDLFEYTKRDALMRMADRLARLSYAQDAAAETCELIAILNQAETRLRVHMQRLSRVWHAVEWWDSGDSGEGVLVVALAEYRSGLVCRWEFAADQGRAQTANGHSHAAGAYVVYAGSRAVFRADVDQGGTEGDAVEFMRQHTAEEFATG
jgi:hypothetical protein